MLPGVTNGSIATQTLQIAGPSLELQGSEFFPADLIRVHWIFMAFCLQLNQNRSVAVAEKRIGEFLKTRKNFKCRQKKMTVYPKSTAVLVNVTQQVQ